MDRVEARAVLVQEMARLRALSYAEVVGLVGNPDCREVQGASGVTYQFEYDGILENDGNVRVMGSVDDGRLLSTLRPVCCDFVMSPTGDLLSESTSR